MKQHKPKKSHGHIEKNFNLFVGSFEKNWFTFIYIALMDLIFYALGVVSIIIAYTFFSAESQKLSGVIITPEQLISPLGVQSNIMITETFFRNSAIIITVLVLVLAVIYALTNHFIWLKIARKKFSFLFFRKFLAVTIPWFIFWALVFFGISYFFKPEMYPSVIPVWVIVFMHSTVVMFSRFSLTISIKNALASVYTLGVRGIKHFLIAYGTMLILFIFINMLLKLLQGVWFTVISMIVYLLFFAWARVYVFEIIEQ